ncbi:MAG TPA: ATP-binding protein [Sphingobacteriaceae bacterium]
MVIEFSVANYRSFYKVQTLSFRASNLKSEDKSVDVRNLLTLSDRDTLLKIVGIYGANASGKSNLLKALSLFKHMVASSLFKDEVGEATYEPFRQNVDPKNDFGFFQIVLLLNQKKYRYGFSLDHLGRLQKEWLFGPADKNDTYYFQRDKAKLQINKENFKEGFDLPLDKLREDALFLSFCASYDGPVSKLIKDFVIRRITFDPGRESTYLRGARRQRTDKLVREGKKEVVLDWLREAGIRYTDIKIREADNGQRIPFTHVHLYKDIYDEQGGIVGKTEMDLDLDESQGTRKFYRLIGRLYQLFEHGGLLVSDDIDGNFHPHLLLKVIQLFQNPKVNRAGAQLLFTSHDTNVMSPEVMRRDQFYFTEKTLQDYSRLYSMADLRGIRNNADFARRYLAGFYGALPQLDNILEQSV